MGTRADFYIRNEKSEPIMEWLGSIGFDGYPDGIAPGVLYATDENKYREQVKLFLQMEQGTLPERGWPWPWDNSQTTDFSYIFENDKVLASSFGYPLFDPLSDIESDEEDFDAQKMTGFFPDMKGVQNVRFDAKGSGMIIINAK